MMMIECECENEEEAEEIRAILRKYGVTWTEEKIEDEPEKTAAD